MLAICQAAAMTHLLIGPAGTAATAAPAGAGTANIGAAAAAAAQGGSSRPKGGSVRGRARMRPFTGASSDGSSARDSSPAGLPGGCDMPQWTLQQEEIARGLQAVMSALTSRFPSDSVSAWDAAKPAIAAGWLLALLLAAAPAGVPCALLSPVWALPCTDARCPSRLPVPGVAGAPPRAVVPRPAGQPGCLGPQGTWLGCVPCSRR